MIATQTLRRNLMGGAALFTFAVLLSATAAHEPPQSSPSATPDEIILTVDPAQSTVHYTVGSSIHTVHGTFTLKRGALRLDPANGKAAGEIVVDAVSGDSGNNSRDKKMHKEVLESSRYTEAIFRPDRLEGALQPQGSSTAQLHGVFVLHGSEHELTVPVQAAFDADHWKGTAHFSIPYNTWGLKNPGNFLLKVDHAVDIEVSMAGTVKKQVAEAKP